MNSRSLIGIAVLLLASTAAAGTPNVLPEPGVLELLAIGGVVAMATAIRKRRK